ncbi:hypothetical protein MTBLM5_200034 [Magnetospirillum sp. LM-5]|nr:hypothetical protein MTBLM5_200034 [Magnetospirillum sp. LM-5]
MPCRCLGKIQFTTEAQRHRGDFCGATLSPQLGNLCASVPLRFSHRPSPPDLIHCCPVKDRAYQPSSLSSWPGLTRPSTRIRATCCFSMDFSRHRGDARVKHGHDGVWGEGFASLPGSKLLKACATSVCGGTLKIKSDRSGLDPGGH